MIIRKIAIRVWTIISVCFWGLCITACDNGVLPDEKKDSVNLELCFTASISDIPSTKTIDRPDIMQGTAFPNGAHTFGMFITNEAGAPVASGSEDNMKSILVRGTSQDTWSHTDKNGQSLSLSAKNGERVNITGYYPWISGATATSVPFDLTGDVAAWIDLLYLASPTGAQQVVDATPIALTYSHAYCWVTIKLSKLTDKNDVTVKAVSIESSYSSEKGIMNKGTINPKTGDVINGTPGPLTINCNPLVNIPLEKPGNTPSEFNFLVPSFMSTDVKNSDIVIRVATSVAGATEVLSFPLSKVHLNNANVDQYGFQKGMHNTYNIVYNNSAMILSLSDWQETLIDDSSLGGGTAGITPFEIPFKSNGIAPDKDLKKISKGDYINHTYLGEVAENNNGNYVKIEPITTNFFDAWKPFVTTEPFYTQLKVAKNDAAGGKEIPWKDEITGVLVAKQACAELREGGYTDWRLPRISELYMLVYDTRPVDLKLNKNEYWSATEYDENECYSVYYNKSTGTSLRIPQHTPKTVSLYVRCVRDSDKPKPTI